MSMINDLIELGGKPAWLLSTMAFCLLTTTYYLKFDSWAEEQAEQGFDNLDRFSLWIVLILSTILFTTMLGLSQQMSPYQAYKHQYTQMLIKTTAIWIVPAARHIANTGRIALDSVDVQEKGWHLTLSLILYLLLIIVSSLLVYFGTVDLPKRAAPLLLLAGIGSYLTVAPILVEELCEEDDPPKIAYRRFVSRLNQITAGPLYVVGTWRYLPFIAGTAIGISWFMFGFSYNAMQPPEGYDFTEVLLQYASPLNLVAGLILMLFAILLLILPPQLGRLYRVVKSIG